MMNSKTAVKSLSSPQLLSATRRLVQESRETEAELLEHLGEIDERKLYLDQAFPSMLAFCVGEYGFSEDAAYQRIAVARAARRLPEILEAIRSGRVHLTGLRLLAPHLTADNAGPVLAEAAGKPTRQIEELVARLAPKPPVPTVIRKVATQAPSPAQSPTLFESPLVTSRRTRGDGSRRSVVAPDLLRHRIPDGDVGAIVEQALDLLIEQVKKERFAAGRKTGRAPQKDPSSDSRHIPDAIKRAVYERDGGRCAFTDENGRRCTETGMLEFDHRDGFARTRVHLVDRIRLACHAHNQHAAGQMYGRAFMERARTTSQPRG